MAPHSSDIVPASLLQLTVPQSSDALAPAFVVIQSLYAAVFPEPSQITVLSCADTSINGDVVSSIVNNAVVVIRLSHSSLAVKVTGVKPVRPQPSEIPK